MRSQESKWAFCEMAGSICWFVMDSFWMEGSSSWVGIFAFPAVLFSLVAFLFIPKELSQILITLAMSCWLFMNLSWAINDLHQLSFFLSLAKVFRIFVVLSLIGSLVFSKFAQESGYEVIKHFRRLRITR